MPTVKRIDGLRVVIYPNDHRPAHVHVIGSDSEAVFDLSLPLRAGGSARELRFLPEGAGADQIRIDRGPG